MIDLIAFKTESCDVQVVKERVLFWSKAEDSCIEISLDDLLNIAAFAMEHRQVNMEKVIDHEL